MFSSFAAVHPLPDTLFSWVFQLFFPYFSSIASRLGPPGFSLEPGSGLWPCLPTLAASRECARGSPWEGRSPLGAAFSWALELGVPAPSPRGRSGIARAGPGAPRGAGSSIRIPSMFQWSAVNQERRAGVGEEQGAGGPGPGAGEILGCFPGERRWEEGLVLLLLPAGNRERENS